MLPPIVVDWETYYDKEYSVKTLGYDRYCRHPRFDPYLISCCDGAEAWAGEPKDFNFEALRGRTLLSVNSAFDEEVALGGQEKGLWDFPDLKRAGMSHWHCVANMGSYFWNVRSLVEIVRIALGESVDKGVRDRACGKTPDDMKREGWWDDMLKYGRADATKPWFVWQKYSRNWPELERRLSRLTIDQGRHGIRIDVAALTEGIALLKKIIFAAQQNLPWVTRGRAPASPIGIAEECRLVGIPTPPVKAHDPEAAEEWEKTYAPLHKFVLALRNLRKAKKTLATLETIQLRLRPDETIAFSLKYAGAHTLRWSGDAGFNLQNINKEPLFIDPEFSFIFDKASCKKYADEFDREHAGNAATGKLKSGTTFFDIRGLIVARPGMKLGPVDLSQIEPRTLNKLAGNEALLAKIREGMGIYEAFARESLGWTGGDLKTQDKKLYALSKADVLGLGFKCGWEKFITVAWIMAGVDITEGDEDFAKAAAVDGAIHKRRRPPGGKGWVYEGVHRFETEAGVFEFGPDKPAVEVDHNVTTPPNSNEWEDCVFVRSTRKRKGQTEVVIKAYSVYGMRSRVTVEEFRRNNPLIVALWDKLQKALEAAEGSDLVVEGPHGGTLTYRNVRREKREKTDPDTGEKYQQTTYTAEIGGRRYALHGGILTENLVQWVARMVFAIRQLDLHDRLQAEDPRQWVLFTVHDEAVPEILDPAAGAWDFHWGAINTDHRRKWLERMMSIAPDWFEGCPLAAEARIVDRYLK